MAWIPIASSRWSGSSTVGGGRTTFFLGMAPIPRPRAGHRCREIPAFGEASARTELLLRAREQLADLGDDCRILPAFEGERPFGQRLRSRRVASSEQDTGEADER